MLNKVKSRIHTLIAFIVLLFIVILAYETATNIAKESRINRSEIIK